MKTLIIDNSDIFRSGLKLFLQDIKELNFVGDYRHSGSLNNIENENVDLILIDVTDKYEINEYLIEKIRKLFPKAFIISFSNFLNLKTQFQYQLKGIDYYFNKEYEFYKLKSFLKNLINKNYYRR